MKKTIIKWGVLSGIILLLLGNYGRNVWMTKKLQDIWCHRAVEVNGRQLIPLSMIEREVELTAQGDYLLDQQKAYDYKFYQRFGKLFIQLYHKEQLDGPVSEEYLVRKQGDTYTFTNNESHFAGVSVATGYQLSPK